MLLDTTPTTNNSSKSYDMKLFKSEPVKAPLMPHMREMVVTGTKRARSGGNLSGWKWEPNPSARANKPCI